MSLHPFLQRVVLNLLCRTYYLPDPDTVLWALQTSEGCLSGWTQSLFSDNKWQEEEQWT